MPRALRTGYWPVWAGTGLALVAIVVGDFDKAWSRALFVVALSLMLAAIGLTFRPPYNMALAVAGPALVVLLTYVVHLPHWLRITAGVVVGLAWVWMYILAPATRHLPRDRNPEGHS